MPATPQVLALSHQVGGYQAPSLSGQYLGIGLLAVLLAGLVVWHRDVRLWLLAAVGVVCACFSFGLAFHHWTLWRLLVRFPLMDNVIPSRFVLFTYLAAAAMLGIVVDHVARAAAGRRPRPPGAPSSAGAPAWRWRRSPWSRSSPTSPTACR